MSWWLLLIEIGFELGEVQAGDVHVGGSCLLGERLLLLLLEDRALELLMDRVAVR